MTKPPVRLGERVGNKLCWFHTHICWFRARTHAGGNHAHGHKLIVGPPVAEEASVERAGALEVELDAEPLW